jgi:hypothetical protein
VFEARKQVWDLLYTLQTPRIHDRGLDRTTLLETELLDERVTEHIAELIVEAEGVCGLGE